LRRQALWREPFQRISSAEHKIKRGKISVFFYLLPGILSSPDKAAAGAQSPAHGPLSGGRVPACFAIELLLLAHGSQDLLQMRL
jgi:hypothetical protein